MNAHRTKPNEAAIFLPKKHFLIRQNFHLQLLLLLSLFETVGSWGHFVGAWSRAKG